MKLNVLKNFRWAHFGHTVKDYAAGTQIDTDQHKDGAELATVALVEGWAHEEGTPAPAAPPPDIKSKGAAPENK